MQLLSASPSQQVHSELRGGLPRGPGGSSKEEPSLYPTKSPLWLVKFHRVNFHEVLRGLLPAGAQEAALAPEATHSAPAYGCGLPRGASEPGGAQRDGGRPPARPEPLRAASGRPRSSLPARLRSPTPGASGAGGPRPEACPWWGRSAAAMLAARPGGSAVRRTERGGGNEVK